MTQVAYSWGHHKRYNSYGEYFKKHFGARVQKVSVDAGFTCPNRNGTLATGGCTYCNNDAFNPSYCQPHKPVSQQILEGIEFHRVRYRRAQNYLVYFQAFSNTYAPLAQLKSLYDEALSVPGVVGLVIGTRPDCIDNEKLVYFEDLSKSKYILLEYGIESCYDNTLKTINRGHSFADSVNALEQSATHHVKTGAHIIFGLPGETEDQLLEEAAILSKLPLTTIKFHQLQIIKNTTMAGQFAHNPENFQLFSLEDYIRFIVRFIERFNPGIVIERMVSEAPPRFQAGSVWSNLRADQVQVMIENELERQNTWQGKLYKP